MARLINYPYQSARRKSWVTHYSVHCPLNLTPTPTLHNELLAHERGSLYAFENGTIMMCFSAFFPCIYMPKATHDFPLLSNWGFSSYHIYTVVIHFLDNLTVWRLSSGFWCSSALNMMKNISWEEEMCQMESRYWLKICSWLISLPSGLWMKCKKRSPKKETLILYNEGVPLSR